MLQNMSCASPVAASTPTRTLGRSARSSWPCETFASSNRSLSLNDWDCAVMRASIRHLLSTDNGIRVPWSYAAEKEGFRRGDDKMGEGEVQHRTRACFRGIRLLNFRCRLLHA